MIDLTCVTRGGQWVGDFNVILGAHEHRGRTPPSRLPMEEFQNWTDAFNLIHLPTTGAEFTWNNGRRSLRHTEKRLDRAICNQSWLDIAAEQKLQQVQHQLQISGPSEELLDEEKVANCQFDLALHKQEMFWKEKANLHWHLEGDRNTKYFHRIAKIKTSTKMITSLQDGEHEPLLAEEVIPKMITDEINYLLTMLPSHQEIKAAVFALNRDSAPGPDGFGAFFFQHYWEILKNDVFNAVLEFFNTSWILPGFNSNIIALLPKVSNATSIDQYRPIAMANFKFKIISKIIADRLAKIMPFIISEEQMGFIHDRNIKDCLCIASEAANLLHNKSFGGNLALKIDISKAFDTLEWSFLLKVLRCFGFNDVFCNWIHVILKSAFLSISINGKAEGYFNCSRGVRQGDPLSPLLFCLAEDVLSRSITNLVSVGKLNPIKGTRHISVPSHTFYADDLMIFCKGKLSGLNALKDLFSTYALQSGQVINNAKSTIFSGSITQGRLNIIVSLLNFKLGSLPFNYLGVPIFKGNNSKQSSSNSIRDFIVLKHFKVSIHPPKIPLLKEVLWQAPLVNWIKCNIDGAAKGNPGIAACGGVFRNSDANFIFCFAEPLGFASSYQAELCAAITAIEIAHTRNWHNLWLETDSTLVVLAFKNSNTKVAWNLRNRWHNAMLLFKQLNGMVSHIYREGNQVADSIANYGCKPKTRWLQPIADKIHSKLSAWKASLLTMADTGELNLSDAYRFKLQQFQDLHWAKLIWNPDIPPSKSCLAWSLMHNKVPTDENLMLRGCALPSMCSLCNKNVESSFHIFFECNNSKQSSSNSIRDFIVLKHFKVSIHPPKIPLLKEVLWQPPLVNWIKCNIDVAAKGNPGSAACGGVFRNSDANFIFCFAEPLGFASSYQAELCAAMTTIEIAHTRNWHNLWLETDSTLVVLAFKNSNTEVAWNLRNRWHNAILAGSP
ncbi:hypothetical protein TSUD_106740 [Trifolium subterraneum]|uniref:Reverse transcriptase domain-containing protein n=1 Tax=Trifolium subterraneum TaxID=3900 RepID=A0A2Z6LU65_TRISU|nr:hypothetical protein TSUD_106740 [Trifolium subterraneum]